MKIFRILTALVLMLMVSQTNFAAVRVPHLFGDHMVLQQNSQCPVWGWANPGELVTVEASWGVNTQITANSSGKWKVIVTTPSYGGPYVLNIHSDENWITLSDVMIGDVFLASGQSNMEIPMMGWPPQDTIAGAFEAIQTSTNDKIRFISVKQTASFTPVEDFEGWWSTARPETTVWYSALAYFFARKLQAETGVPIGIINASWAGSNCESWMSREALSSVPGFEDEIKEYDASFPKQEELSKWIKSHRELVITGDQDTRFAQIDYNDEDCASLNYDDSQWQQMKLPCYYDNAEIMGTYDGVVWFRRWVDIPKKWQEKQLILSLGSIDDMDATFVNGELVGETLREGMWNVDREYKILPGLVREGKMLIAVRMIDNGNGGGICGRTELLNIHPEGEKDSSISLAGYWKYLPTAEFFEDHLYQYDHKSMEYYKRPKVEVTLSNKTITANYNGMIKPIMPYKIAGLIWYQGESNVGRAEEYLKLLPKFAECMRESFNTPQMKFYYCQLAPYDYAYASQSFELREAQRRAMDEIPNSGMACLVDIGKKESFHPATKREAAERLALWALHDIYGKNVETSGPNYQSMTITKNTIELTFTHTTGGLQIKGEGLSNFEIGDSRNNYLPAHAEIRGNKVIVSCPEISNPKNVRYCWKNYVSNVSLYNGAGLPAIPFTTEKKITPKKEVYE